MTEDDDKILKVDVLGRVRVSREDREAILDEFERSGMPGTRFAAKHGIKYPTFANWIQKRRRTRGQYPEEKPDTGKAPVSVARSKFALVEVRPEAPAEQNTAGSALRIALPGGASLSVEDERQAELAAALLAALPTASTPASPC